MIDFLIVGAGTAGCVLTNRLSANLQHRVVLLEAGGLDDDPSIRIPGRWNSLLGSYLDWGYQSEPQTHLNGRCISLNRGKVVGGTSAINGMVYMRGHPKDFDRWVELGNKGWAFEDVEPYFKKLEHFEGADSFYGKEGPIHITTIPDVLSQHKRFLEAAELAGFKRNPNFNGASQEGIGIYHHTLKNGERQSVADAYLKPILGRANLRLETRAHACKILFEKNRAVGLEYVQNNQVKQLEAKEVILCGGAINSPQLLLCSGVGAAKQLESFGIPVIADLPGVGENLQDHPMLNLRFKAKVSPRVDTGLNTPAYQDYLRDKTGLLQTTRTFAGGFWKTRENLALPDMQVYFSIGELKDDNDFAIGLSLTRPKSRGYIKLRSSNPFDYPVINPNYLEHTDDLRVYIDSVRLARKIVSTPAFDDFLENELAPGNGVQTNEAISNWIREALTTLWHYSGTCKMGQDAMSVVSEDLNVHQLEGLRVVDASIMPEITGGNINAPILMLAEKAAELILSES